MANNLIRQLLSSSVAVALLRLLILAPLVFNVINETAFLRFEISKAVSSSNWFSLGMAPLTFLATWACLYLRGKARLLILLALAALLFISPSPSWNKAYELFNPPFVRWHILGASVLLLARERKFVFEALRDVYPLQWLYALLVFATIKVWFNPEFSFLDLQRACWLNNSKFLPSFDLWGFFFVMHLSTAFWAALIALRVARALSGSDRIFLRDGIWVLTCALGVYAIAFYACCPTNGLYQGYNRLRLMDIGPLLLGYKSAIVFAAVFSISGQGSWLRFLSLASSTIVMTLTVTRTALLGGIAAVMTAVCVRPLQNASSEATALRRRVIFVAVISLLCLVIVSVTSSKNYFRRYYCIDCTTKITEWSLKTSRPERYRWSMKAILEHPFLGLGVNWGWAFKRDHDSATMQAPAIPWSQNYYFDLALTGGLPMVVVFLGVLCSLARTMLRLQPSGLPILIAMVWMNLFTSALREPGTTWLVYIILFSFHLDLTGAGRDKVPTRTA